MKAVCTSSRARTCELRANHDAARSYGTLILCLAGEANRPSCAKSGSLQSWRRRDLSSPLRQPISASSTKSLRALDIAIISQEAEARELETTGAACMQWVFSLTLLLSSRFRVEMDDASYILEKATDKSLVSMTDLRSAQLCGN